MRDPDWESMDEQEFEALLESSVSQPPPEEVVAEVTPWRLATKRILTGIGLTTMTLNFFWLNYLLPAIGMALMLLGFRALRRENRWLGLCFKITVLRAVYLYATLILNSTIWFSTVSSSVLYGLTGLNLTLTFVQFFCLWQGFRTVQQKAGLPPHAGSAVALLVWYGIIGLLAALQYNGLILPLALLISYICILRSLWKLSKQLDQAGYAIRPAPVRIEDGIVAVAITILLVVGCLLGWLLGCKYPMDWQAADPDEHSGVEGIEAQLLELGFPDYVLRDLTAEDIAACDGALRVVAETREEPMNGNDWETPRVTSVAVKLPGEPEQWMMIHHFSWAEYPGFYGTESIQIWPAYQDFEVWRPSGEATGRVLYDKNGQTYTAPYYFLDDQTFTSDSMFWGEQTSTDLFAAFSMPGTGEHHRGYLAYSIQSVGETRLISSWFNYTHQRTGLQYPVVTAMEHRMSGIWYHSGPFQTMQFSAQFLSPELNGESPAA